MVKSYKFVITGAFNAGKTTFVETSSDIDPVNTDRAISSEVERKVKESTTVALDYGKTKIGRHIIHLFGTPGQERFDFMRTILAQDMDGFIFLIDSTDPATLQRVAELLATFKEMSGAPYVLAANKTDQKGVSLAQIRQRLKLPKSQALLPCVATDKASVRVVVEQLITLIESD